MPDYCRMCSDLHIPRLPFRLTAHCGSRSSRFTNMILIFPVLWDLSLPITQPLLNAPPGHSLGNLQFHPRPFVPFSKLLQFTTDPRFFITFLYNDPVTNNSSICFHALCRRYGSWQIRGETRPTTEIVTGAAATVVCQG